ncbi:hypothetical protein [Paraburkholderia unamae]|uniref:hypothetical protein n=1 Tax=Paraburkholderia unamae TaxID=219649 RepID=UPI0015ECA95D|nr:hypothetical protein [Paraburkholderia unamae]
MQCGKHAAQGERRETPQGGNSLSSASLLTSRPRSTCGLFELYPLYDSPRVACRIAAALDIQFCFIAFRAVAFQRVAQLRTDRHLARRAVGAVTKGHADPRRPCVAPSRQTGAVPQGAVILSGAEFQDSVSVMV